LAEVATSFEPWQPMPCPRKNRLISSGPTSHRGKGGMDMTASSWSSFTSADTS
jgi:hypothetical protein